MINHRFKANRPKIIGKTDMTPRWETVAEIIEDSDVVLEVLDARMPMLSRNEEVEKIIRINGKRLIFILNKADLISERQLQINYRKLLKLKEGECFIFSAREKVGTKRLRDYLFSLAKTNEKEGFEGIRIGVVGYPNTGKSSVINALALKKKAVTSAKAGTTHGVQWIKAFDKLFILDSPGVIPVGENDEVRHSLIVAKNVERVKKIDLVASSIIQLFDDKKELEKQYKIEITSDDPEEIIKEIGQKKGFIKRGGVVDESRTSIQIIKDWQNGKLRL
ncbi:MAG: GTPase [Candidatus Pacearchaeota archaeon]|jgi:hypothetical protein